jgi:hypothetical protein
LHKFEVANEAPLAVEEVMGPVAVKVSAKEAAGAVGEVMGSVAVPVSAAAVRLIAPAPMS